MNARGVLVALAASSGAACSSGPPADLCDRIVCGSEQIIGGAVQTTIERDLDLLFVVDDTSAMAPFVAELASAPSAWNAALDAYTGLSVHAAAVSATSCAPWPATRAAACGLPASVPFLVARNCGRDDNFVGPLDAELACLTDFGVSSCPPAQPLAAMRGVLVAPPAGWESFLRPTAYLMIVVVVAEDDASDVAVASLADDLRSLKDDPANRIAVSIVGPANAPRLTELAQDFGVNGRYAPLGADSLSRALDLLAPRLQTLVDPPCLYRVRDTDPATPGVQADCTVEDTVTPVDGTPTTAVLASCDVASPPCWRIEAGSPGCGSRFGFIIDRGPDFCPAMSTITRFQCLACLDPGDPACAPPPP